MKKIMCILAFINITQALGTSDFRERIIFNNPELRKLDGMKVAGVHLGIDEISVRDITWTRRQIARIQFGAHTKEGKEVKDFALNDGTPVTLKDLVQLEEQLNLNQQMLVKIYHDLEYKNDGYNSARSIKQCLEEVKDSFIKKMEPFMIQARVIKRLILELISEWAEQRERPDTFLLTWAQTKNNEAETVKNELVTCKAMDDFCEDLRCFLADLVHSCPKARQEYEDRFGKK